jgi:hypothetical protein
VLARHTSPDRQADGTAGSGKRFRLMLGCYPIADEGAAGPVT